MTSPAATIRFGAVKTDYALYAVSEHYLDTVGLCHSNSVCMILLSGWFAEILPRFISKPMSHKAHKRIFSDRDPLFYWLYALGKAGAGVSLVFITPRSAVRSCPPLPM
jgi:hypothetical protein